MLAIFPALLLASSLEAQSDLVARIHFLGGDKIAADPNSRSFTNEFSSPEARAFGAGALDKVSRVAAAWFKPASGAGNSQALLRPLLDDLAKSEWVLEIKDGARSPEYALAIRLHASRAEAWAKDLQAVAQSWSGSAVVPGKDGWEAKKQNPAGHLRFSRAGDWVVIDCGPDALTLQEGIVPVGPETNWLSANVDWPRLAQLFPSLREFDLPKFAFEMTARDGYFRFNGKLNLSQPLTSEPWRMPTNYIHQPFVSFMAARGIGPWLARQPWFRPYLVQPQPNQVFVWAMPQIPFQTFAAEPVPNSSTALAGLQRDLSANAAWKDQFTRPVTLTLTNDRVALTGFPFIAPFAQAVHEPGGDFLAGGFFPNTPRSKGLPPELFEQLNAPGVVYYQWEITGDRLKGVHELTQLLLMLTKRDQLDGRSTAFKWLQRVGPTLGNSVTIVKQASPTELTFTRKSHSGLTAFELLLLANWVESPRFPAMDLHQADRPRLVPVKRSAAPPPMPLPSK